MRTVGKIEFQSKSNNIYPPSRFEQLTTLMCDGEDCCRNFLKACISIRPNWHTIFLHTILRWQDKKILQYKDKKTFFIQNLFSCVNWKYLFLDNYVYWNIVRKYFLMSLQYFEENLSFLSKCLFIFLSKYFARKYPMCISPKVSRKFAY